MEPANTEFGFYARDQINRIKLALKEKDGFSFLADLIWDRFNAACTIASVDPAHIDARDPEWNTNEFPKHLAFLYASTECLSHLGDRPSLTNRVLRIWRTDPEDFRGNDLPDLDDIWRRWPKKQTTFAQFPKVGDSALDVAYKVGEYLYERCEIAKVVELDTFETEKFGPIELRRWQHAISKELGIRKVILPAVLDRDYHMLVTSAEAERQVALSAPTPIDQVYDEIENELVGKTSLLPIFRLLRSRGDKWTFTEQLLSLFEHSIQRKSLQTHITRLESVLISKRIEIERPPGENKFRLRTKCDTIVA